MSMPDDFRFAARHHLVGTGTLRGVIEAYADCDASDPAHGTAQVRVTETSLADLPEVVTVTMGQAARDANFLIKDLCYGYQAGDLAPVPVGSSVTFTDADVVNDGVVEAASYDTATIERAETPSLAM